LPDFYFQIKTKNNDDYGISKWAFPPLFSGKVEAINKKDARVQIEAEYGRQFPLRVLEKDLKDEHYLLHIEQIREDDERTKGIFELRKCVACENTFRRIDLYNDHNETYKGVEYCGAACKEDHRLLTAPTPYDASIGQAQAVIYRVQNVVSGKSYIGKTTQVFTLRWYQHFFHGNACKFHTAIRNSKLEDWLFMIIETVQSTNRSDDMALRLAERERFWINHYNAIEDGYNSL